MKSSSEPGHWSRAELQAYEAGECDAGQAARMAEHLSRCARCREALRSVQTIRSLFDDMNPVEPDDLSWQRLRHRIWDQLAEDPPATVPAQNMGSGWHWAGVGLAMAATTFFLVWLEPLVSLDRPRMVARAPEVQTQGEVSVAPTPRPEVATVSDGSSTAPSLTLPRQAVATPKARLQTAVNGAPRKAALELENAEFSVRLAPLNLENDEPEVRTPEFRAVASSSEYAVGLLASDYGADAVPRNTRRVPKSRGTRFGRDVVSEPTKVASMARPATNGRGVAPEAGDGHGGSRLGPQPSEEHKVHSAVESRGVLTIEHDPITARWLAASRAYYVSRDVPRAIKLAKEVVDTKRDRPEWSLAKALLCEALSESGRPREAAVHCKDLLEAETESSRIVFLSLRLAKIHQRHLQDEEEAFAFYEIAIDNGARGDQLEEAMLGHAWSALRLGRWARVEADLMTLEKVVRGRSMSELALLRHEYQRLRDQDPRR